MSTRPIDDATTDPDIPQGWRVTRMSGGSRSFSHAFVAIAPDCPTERHPQRYCQCGTAKTYDDAVKLAQGSA